MKAPKRKVYAGLRYSEANAGYRQDQHAWATYGFTGDAIPVVDTALHPEHLLGFHGDEIVVEVCGELGDWLYQIDALRAHGVTVRPRMT